MAMDASALREIRTRLRLSQSDARRLLVSPLETFRTWDAGRRRAPEAIISKARALNAKRPRHDRMPLQVLADELHVHVRILCAAVPHRLIVSAEDSSSEWSNAGATRVESRALTGG